MFRMSNLAILSALAIGTACGWAAASGKFDALLRAGSTQTAEPTAQSCSPCLRTQDCSAHSDRSAAISALSAHNEKVSTNLGQDGKKPNILVIWSDDIGTTNLSCYSDGLMGSRRPTSTESLEKGSASFTTTGSKVALRAARRS